MIILEPIAMWPQSRGDGLPQRRMCHEKKLEILILDDEPIVSERLKAALQKDGFCVSGTVATTHRVTNVSWPRRPRLLLGRLHLKR